MGTTSPGTFATHTGDHRAMLGSAVRRVTTQMVPSVPVLAGRAESLAQRIAFTGHDPFGLCFEVFSADNRLRRWALERA